MIDEPVLDALMATLCLGDPDEQIDMPTIERMARAVINAGWTPPGETHDDWSDL